MPKWVFGLSLFFVILFTVFFRFYNLDWDSGHHLHPDERFLTMVSTDLKWPTTFTQFLNTDSSPFNPHNRNYSFFVYGTFPIFITKWIAGLLSLVKYTDLILVGRFLSAFLYFGSAILVFVLTLKITRNKYTALLSLFLYSCLPTAIQLSHFYATDTWVTFFTLLSFYLVIKINHNLAPSHPRWGLLSPRVWITAASLGISLGLLLASKISGALFLPIIGLALIFPLSCRRKQFVTQGSQGNPQRSRVEQIGYVERLRSLVLSSLITLLFFFLTLRLAQPYLFSGPGFFDLKLNPKVIANWTELKNMNNPDTTPPYGFQWIPTLPIVYPALNLFFWGLGIPFSILIILSLLTLTFRFRQLASQQVNQLTVFLCALWCLLLFLYQGTQFAKALRYLYPMTPFLAIIVGISVFKIINHKSYLISRISYLKLVLVFWNSLAFLSIYSRPHTRMTASEWIYQNITPGSVITSEIWDDGLPLPLGRLNSSLYTTLALPLYDPDTPLKWNQLSHQLSQTDYVILTSNRLWRSIAALPDRFPQSALFYDNLLHDRLGFQTVAVFTSYPCLIPKLSTLSDLPSTVSYTDVTPPSFSLESNSYCHLALNTDGADETFTVYDHPKVIILKNVARHSPQTLYSHIWVEK